MINYFRLYFPLLEYEKYINITFWSLFLVLGLIIVVLIIKYLQYYNSKTKLEELEKFEIMRRNQKNSIEQQLELEKNNQEYIKKVSAITPFPILFEAKKPNTQPAKDFLKKYSINPKEAVFVGDRPLTDILCGKLLGCKTILVDSITADKEAKIVRFVRKLERCSIRK